MVSHQSIMALLLASLMTVPAAFAADDGEDSSRLSDEPIPLDDSMPDRPRPLIEFGTEPFVGTGAIEPGIEIATGAVLQPQLLVFGQYRTAVQSFHNGNETFSEWTNRLDLFANLRLSGTERVLVGYRPFDQDGQFTGYNFEPNDRFEGWQDNYGQELTTLFFEGDIGEIFPLIDPDDHVPLDFGIGVGRQPIFIQEGMLINDTLDSVGLTRNSIHTPWTSNVQITGLWAWNELNRNDNAETDGKLAGLFTQIDFELTTMALDFAYVYDDEFSDSLHWGISAVQRIGEVNTSFRVLGSQADDGDQAGRNGNYGVSDGMLLFSEVSWTPHATDDIMYINSFYGIDEYSSAARGPATGGPLGRAGVLFAAVGMGRYGAALGNRADRSIGAGLGYQMILDGTRRQIIMEVGGRTDTDEGGDGAFGFAARFQQALGQNLILRLDGFVTGHETAEPAFGGRTELLVKF